MDLMQILKDGLSDSPFSDSLGDRSQYIGASDVAGCPRKAVLTKLDAPEHDLGTLIKFARGHLTELMLIAGLKKHSKSLPKWKHQYEAKSKMRKHIKAHLDFLFTSKNVLAVLEVKSVDGIPADPYEGWVQQVHMQMGLVKEEYPDKAVKGAIFAIDLNQGEARLFNGYQYDGQIYEGLLQKAESIWKTLNDQANPNYDTEKGPLCAWCHYRPDCPAYKANEAIPEMPFEKELNEYRGLKEQGKTLEAEIKKLKAFLKSGIKNANPDDKKVRVGEEEIKIGIWKRSSINSQKLQTEYPDVYEDCLKTASYEVLRV